LFDANIFYPEKNTFAFSEHLFTQAILGLPLQLAGASPVLVYNLLVLAGFALTGWATCLVLYRVTGDWMPGLLSGTLLGFNTYALTHLPHIQALHLEFLAPAVLALHVLLTRPSARPAVLLAVLFSLQALTSNYFMVAIALAIGAAVLMRPQEWWVNGGRLVVWAAVCLAITALVLLPFVLPYVEMRSAHGFIRPLAPSQSATWRDYLTTGSRIHFDSWSRHFWPGRAPLFPGAIAIVFTALALWSGTAWRNRFARLWIGIGIALTLMSLGAHAPWYQWAHERFAVIQGIRSPARLGQFTLAAFAILAGFGLAWVRARWNGRRWLPAVSVAVILLANAEALRAPMGFVPAVPIPPAYDVLAREKHAVVAEFPFPPPRQFYANTAYMLASTRHWHPLLNGYSGFVPGSYTRAWLSLTGFPDTRSLDALRDLRVTHVVIHYRPMFVASSLRRPKTLPAALEPVADTRALGIYRLRWDRIPDWP
jgi:hypothetical protein